jgi:hypothetical protein
MKRLFRPAMKTKICCFMDRDCTPACVAYSVSGELSEAAKSMGLSEMHCMRLLLELADLMNFEGLADSEEIAG